MKFGETGLVSAQGLSEIPELGKAHVPEIQMTFRGGVTTIMEQAFWSLTAPVIRVAAPDTPYPIASLEQLYVPSAERALDAVRRVMAAA